ncbi:sodium/potassium-transporting ATPase subunit gamma-like [Arapaima gigas]
MVQRPPVMNNPSSSPASLSPSPALGGLQGADRGVEQQLWTSERPGSRRMSDFGDEDFTYDYELVRRGGLIVAAVAFCIGIAIIFSKRFRCGKKTPAKNVNLNDL